jgi:hypothetical protein
VEVEEGTVDGDCGFSFVEIYPGVTASRVSLWGVRLREDRLVGTWEERRT